MPSEVFVPVELDDDLRFAIVRFNQPGVMALFDISEASGRCFDQYRMPVIWIDEDPPIDLGASKSLADILSDSEPTTVHFVCEDKMISSVIWHGDISLGSGCIPSLLKAKKIIVRVYYADYTIDQFDIVGDALTSFQREVQSALFGS